MPNRTAKNRKLKKQKLTEKWKIEGRTAKQHKKWLAKQKEADGQLSIYGKR